MAKEIERLANAFFSGLPGPAPNAPATPPLAPTLPGGGAVTPPASFVPSHVGPSALAVGAGGASPGAGTMPPAPGPLQAPPLASSPPPKESDLRGIPTLLAEHLGLGSTLVLVTTPEPSSTPYFLDLAGMPGSGSPLSSPTAPALPSSGAPSYPGAPSPQGAPPYPAGLQAATNAPSPLQGAPDVGAPAGPTLPVTTGYDFQPELVPDLGTSAGLFDPNTIKRDFPILQERVHGRPLVWLDNAATTQKPQAVIDRISYFYEHENSNIHRAAHALAARATDAYEGARDKVRRFLNAPSTREIVFVRGATEGINLVAQSWGRRNVSRGDEIVITWLEHHANIVPWQQLCAEKGARLRVAPVDDRGQVVLEEYEKLLGPKTRIVSFTQVSNALGTVVPARDMVTMAHRHGARVLGTEHKRSPICPWTSRRSIATFIRSRVTKSSRRRASESSTASRTFSRRCLHGRAVAT
jgi:cysteine desulfurase / selenocysteine lyase